MNPSPRTAPPKASNPARVPPAIPRKNFEIGNPELYERVRISVQKACPKWLSHESEDLSQKVLLRLMERSAKNPEHNGFCASYIYRTAHNTVIDEVRKRRRELLVEDPEPSSLSSAQPDSAKLSPCNLVRDNQVRAAIFHCLGKIRAERRVAISMKLQGHSTLDIAQLLDWNSKRVENMTSRGRQDLRVCLEKKGFKATCPK